MHGRPIWGVSVWAGFVCMLFAFSSLLHGEIASSAVMVLGACVLFGWAAWLDHGRR